MSMRHGIPSLSVLQAFEASARHQSFSKAAAELKQTQGAICKKVNELEAGLGFPLFDRVRQRLVLTEPGIEYARRIRVHLDQIRLDTLELIQHQTSPPIRLAVGVTFAAQWLVPRLRNFHEQYPGVELRLMGRDQPTYFNDLNFDAAIYFGQSLLPGMAGQALITVDEIWMVCAPELLGHGRECSTSDIAALPWIHTRDQATAWQEWRETLKLNPVEHTGGEHYFDMFIMAINAAVSGLGIALLPRLLIDQELRSGKLVRMGQYAHRGSATLYLSFPEQKRDLAPLTKFITWMESAVKDYKASFD
jgi:DNA-binding transcriptional LysR family regulator